MLFASVAYELVREHTFTRRIRLAVLAAGRAGRLVGSLRHYILCLGADNIAVSARFRLTR